MKTKTLKENIEEAKEAHCDLNILAAVVQLLEGGLTSASIDDAAQRIIKISQNEQSKCLYRMDRAMARAGAPHKRASWE